MKLTQRAVGKLKPPNKGSIVRWDGEVAGLWDRWRGRDGQAIESCTILTTTPNELLADVHDPMPVILGPEHHERWLDPSMQDVATAVGLVKPFDSSLMRRYPVSTRVNLVANNDPACSALALACSTRQARTHSPPTMGSELVHASCRGRRQIESAEGPGVR